MFIFFALVIIGILWVMQSFFLKDFYHKQKINQMKNYGLELENQIRDSGFSQETLDEMEKTAQLLNGRVTVMDNNGSISIQQGNMMGIPRMVRIPTEIWRRVRNREIVPFRIPGHMGRMESIGLLIPADNYFLLIQTPLEVIEESVAISKQFYLYILLVAFIAAIFLSMILSRTITKPLVKLNKVASEMSKLNFDVRWDEDRGDEIGELGETINFLMDKLKKTFGDLKQELLKEKDLEKMRKQFVARVSHELQTPIALVGGYTEALQDKVYTDEDEEREYFQIIEEEMSKMSNMVRDLLDLSQLESGSFKVKVETFEISSVIENLLSKFRILHRDKNLQFSITAKNEEYYVSGDEYRIEQVITNLLQNAVNHCSINGHIDIKITEGIDKIVVEVFNEGNPIKEEDLPYIWESFYKSRDRKSGTGLGLAIVKNVLDLHKSDYGVLNTSKGVVFFFHLEKAREEV